MKAGLAVKLLFAESNTIQESEGLIYWLCDVSVCQQKQIYTVFTSISTVSSSYLITCATIAFLFLKSPATCIEHGAAHPKTGC